jgi:hypothetical protein
MTRFYLDNAGFAPPKIGQKSCAERAGARDVAITTQEHLLMAGFKGLKSKAQSAANTHRYFEHL